MLQHRGKIVISISQGIIFKEFESVRWKMQMSLIPTVIIFTLLVYFYALLTFNDDSVLIKSAAIISCECAVRQPADVTLVYLFKQ